MTKMLRITAKRDGYRRCGVAHYGTADHPLEDFDKAQIETLTNDPLLVVQEVDEGAPMSKGAARKADEIIAEAKASAEKIVADAQAVADQILAEAKAKAEPGDKGGKKTS